MFNLLQVGKAPIHSARAAPVSVQVTVTGALGTRAPLQEYMIKSSARYIIVEAVAGMVTEFGGGVGIVSHPEKNAKLKPCFLLDWAKRN